MASAESAPASAREAGTDTLSPLSVLRLDASREARRRSPQAPDAALWSAFGSAATDRQRINLWLRLPDEPSARFYHAGELLGVEIDHDLADSLPEPVRRVAPAVQAMLEAAQSMLRWHRTRLYFGPGSAPVHEREDCVVLEWRRSRWESTGPAVEVVPLDAFTEGGWSGGPARDPAYALATQSMVAACVRLRALADALQAEGGRLAVAIRTFEPA
ncbi:hypothetical protein [Luteimonas saliphila]|uniref:hypothetical protein n=1 Tax=Luteimonas saliphila TaxID=2804919 RepID=UPI00192D410F|nr:hypothetical protein [Luteimonas saliphila]